MNEINWKFKIGDHIQDDKRDLIITDRVVINKSKHDSRRNMNYISHLKCYKYKCLKCGYECDENYKNGKYFKEHYITEGHLIKNRGCACCCSSPQITVPNINSIISNQDTLWMINLFKGGYDEAKKYTPCSTQKVTMICPNCHTEIQNKRITDVKRNNRLSCDCNDNISFCEKFMIQIFKQLHIKYKWQATKNYFKWIDNLISYDFYLPDYNCIIETHGEQHYRQSGYMRRNLKEEQTNDNFKEKLAIDNGIIHYIILNCKNVNEDILTKVIMSSDLYYLLNLENQSINWNQCYMNASKNIVKEVCDYFNNNQELSTVDIGNEFGLNKVTIRKYLVFGTKYNWCCYNANKEKQKAAQKSIKSGFRKNIKPIEIFKDNISLGIFPSGAELSKQSEFLFGVKLMPCNITDTCLGKYKQYKGFTFTRITQKEYNQLKQGEINEKK